MTKFIVIIFVVLFVYVMLWAFRKIRKWKGGEHGWAFKGRMGDILRNTLGEKCYGTLNPYRGSEIGDFLVSLLFLSAAVMNADKKVLISEVDYVKKYFLSLFGRKEAEEFIKNLRIMLNQQLEIESVSNQIGQYMPYPLRLQLLHVLFGIASADDSYHVAEVDILNKIAGYMGVLDADFLFICDIFVKPIKGAYEILETSPDASYDEVKKNYHKLLVEYDPVRVSHLGEHIRKAASLKSQTLKTAFVQIEKQQENEFFS